MDAVIYARWLRVCFHASYGTAHANPRKPDCFVPSEPGIPPGAKFLNHVAYCVPRAAMTLSPSSPVGGLGVASGRV
jgi:hypothetical protein